VHPLTVAVIGGSSTAEAPLGLNIHRWGPSEGPDVANPPMTGWNAFACEFACCGPADTIVGTTDDTRDPTGRSDT
jgi:hypothetical protein